MTRSANSDGIRIHTGYGGHIIYCERPSEVHGKEPDLIFF